MQIHIDFSTNMLNLPVSYNSIVQGFIYNTLSVADPCFSYYIHNKGRKQGVNLFKLFTFSRLKGKYDIRRREIIFPRTASLEIRSPDISFIENFLRGCSEGDTVQLGTNHVRIDRIAAEDKKITENTVSAFCLSPFVYPDEFPQCNLFNHDMAKYKLINNARNKWLSEGFDGADFALDVDFTGCQPKKAQCVFKNTYIIGWDTPFLLKGNPEIIDFLYNTGIGNRNSQGFGMFGINEL